MVCDTIDGYGSSARYMRQYMPVGDQDLPPQSTHPTKHIYLHLKRYTVPVMTGRYMTSTVDPTGESEQADHTVVAPNHILVGRLFSSLSQTGSRRRACRSKHICGPPRSAMKM